ncbi:CG14180, partial [Drosophila busckii]
LSLVDLKNMAAANDGTLEFSSSSTNSNSNSNSNSSNNYVAASQPLDSRYAAAPAQPPPLPPPAVLGPPPRALEQLVIYENFNVHETHRIEDGVCTHISRLPPKKQELLKQFGIQSSSQQCLSNYEKCILIENFIKFCNEYQISDHRPFLDFHESALSKCEQLKFVRYLGQGLSNLTLNKIYVAFKELLSNARTEKLGLESYNLDFILKKKRKNLYSRLHAVGKFFNILQLNMFNLNNCISFFSAASSASVDLTAFDSPQSSPRSHHAFAAVTATPQLSEVCNDQYSYVQR